MKRTGIETLGLQGLHLRPSQVWGGVRVVPLCRDESEVSGDLRLYRREHDSLGVVDLGGRPQALGQAYVSYVPHALVLSYSEDGSPAAALGASMIQGREGHGLTKARQPRLVTLHHRMVKREDEGVLRFLPLHLAMEGFLSLCFGGPDIAWSEYSQQALRTGLSPRGEWSVSGRSMPDLEDALRLFEIHDDQCGALLLCGEALAAAFVVPRPQDYRQLHRTLLCDFFGETLLYYARYNQGAVREGSGFRLPDLVADVDGLRSALALARAAWAAQASVLAEGLLGREASVETVYRAGPFLLQRFCTDLDLAGENHIGERIVRGEGSSGVVEYLKSYRLSDRQTRRAYLLKQLAAHDFNLERTAAGLRTTDKELVRRLVGAGFGYLLAEPVLRQARRR